MALNAARRSPARDATAARTSRARNARHEPAAPDAAAEDAPDGVLRFARRRLVAGITLLALALPLVGFVAGGHGAPVWPSGLHEPLRRGRILSADGTVLAEGDVRHRVYPEGALAAHLVGFSGAEQPDGRYGLEGLEYAYDAELQAGEDVVLTIDARLQAAAQRELAATAERVGAESATAVLLEVGTGRVLAAASWPAYDPNRQEAYPRSAIRNRAFTKLYDPGSVMKPFVVAALIEAGRLDPDETIPAPQALRVGDKTFRDVSWHDPELSVPDVLRYSSNTAMLEMTTRFAPQELHAWLQHFGFGRPVGLHAVPVSTGVLRDARDWVPQDQASITIGQGVSVTALQLATAYGIFANDGALVPPRLVESEEAPAGVQVLSPETAREVRRMLQHVVEDSGLAATAIPGTTTAGKTGTADIYDPATGTYPEDWYTLTFAGMFPAERPRAVLVVSVDKPDPELDPTSTYVAAPLFSAIGAQVAAMWADAPLPADVPIAASAAPAAAGAVPDAVADAVADASRNGTR